MSNSHFSKICVCIGKSAFFMLPRPFLTVVVVVWVWDLNLMSRKYSNIEVVSLNIEVWPPSI